MADNEIKFKVSADTKEAEANVEAFGDKLTSISKKIAGGVAAYLSFKTLVAGLEKSIEAAAESDAALRSFSSALSLAGKYSEEAASKFENFASSLEKTTGVSDEVILKNSAMLVSLGNLSGEGLERATKASLDLAKGMQVDVGTAFDIVTKASQGNVMALARYGLEVNKSDSDSQKFAKTLEFIQTKFGGLASGSINTFEGSLNKMKLGFDDIFESIGKVITKSPKMAALFQVIGDAFYSLSKSISESKGSIDVFVDALFKIGSFLTTMVLTPLEVISRVLITGLLGLPRIMLSVYSEAAGILDKLFGTNLEEKIKPFKESIENLQNAAINPLISDDQLVSTKIANSIDNAKIKVDELASKMTNDLPKASAEASQSSLSNWQAFVQGFSTITGTMIERIKSLGTALRGTFITGFSNAFAAMGKALISGGNLMEAFGKAMLGTLGQLAMQLSQFFILEGIGMMFGGSVAAGAGLIAAGAAIGVLGGVLMALGGGGAGAPAGGGASTANAGDFSSSNGGFGGTQTAEAERMTPQTGVQVVVQGNVFDSKETGLQIAQILNDSFDLSGTLVRANA